MSEQPPPDVEDPGYGSVKNFLLYSLSVPERALRSVAGMASGVARESCVLLIPQAFQSSRTYTTFVRQMLDFLCEDVGGVAPKASANPADKVENFVARKTIGNFIELAGLATFHLSPLTMLAIVSDVAYGSQAYLHELAEELKKEGVIDDTSTIHHVDDLLAAVASASCVTATALDTPPLSVEGLKKTIEETRQAVSLIDPTKVLPREELSRLWDEMHELSSREQVTVLEMSGAVTMSMLDKMEAVSQGALSSVTVAGRLADRHILNHYKSAIGDIRDRGIYRVVSETSGPYVEAVWLNFSAEKSTFTQDVLSGKIIGQAYRAVGRWVGKDAAAPSHEGVQSPPDGR